MSPGTSNIVGGIVEKHCMAQMNTADSMESWGIVGAEEKIWRAKGKPRTAEGILVRGKLKALFMGQAHLCADRLITLKSYLLILSPLILTEDTSMGAERSTSIMTLYMRYMKHYEATWQELWKDIGHFQVL